MVSTPSPPAPPDPKATAEAQGQMNKETAVAQYGLNATNQYTPYGSLTYNQIGTWQDGTPRYSATQTLSPEQQKLYDLGTGTQTNLGQIGLEQSDKIRGILNTPFDLNAATSNQQSDIATKLLDPVWSQREKDMQSDLINRGIYQGSEAYKNAMDDFSRQRDTAYNSAALSGRAQATQEALANRNQPLNEISALMSGSQVSQPNFVGTPQSNVQPVDYTGLVENNYQGQLANYNTQMGSRNALFGALGSIGGAALGGWGMGGYKKFW